MFLGTIEYGKVIIHPMDGYGRTLEIIMVPEQLH